ncbi:MAG TPA: phosphatase PAP2 family protein [Xanthobacteraceae bacterium]|nr:phosphatase PAP2 family protein [Xanthobacteraceae bacterium]
MTRTGLAVALAVAVVAGLVLGVYPQLDLAVARLFMGEGGFPLAANATLRILREGSSAIIALLAAPAAVAVGFKLVRPQRRMLVRGRAALFLLSTLVLGPALVTNAVLKEHYGRARPIHVTELGGHDTFTPWWDPRGACPANCSFVAGEASGAFWTLAPAALAPPAWRPLAYGAAIAFGTMVGLLRMAFGGHFLSDVIFAGVLTFVIVWLAHGAIYRWRRTRLSDEAIERALERLALALRRPFRPQNPPRLMGEPADLPDRGG